MSRRTLAALNRTGMRILRHSVIVKGLLYRVLWQLPESFREQSLIRTTLKNLSKTGKPVFFVNIGANDGLAGDPLREFIVTRGWSGILVEPVDYVFERLKKAYRGFPPSRIKLENAAISEITGAKKFWYLAQNPALPPGYDQIGSFEREHVLKHRDMFPGLEPYVVSREVPCITYSDLISKHGGRSPDLVFVDTEGHDYEVIKQIDLALAPPSVIIFESAHLSRQDLESCCNRLQNAGYRIREEDGNTVAERLASAI